MRILLLASHAVAEYDDLRMLSDLGYDVFSPGGYQDPAHPADDLRPPLPGIPYHADLHALCDIQRAKHASDRDGVRWAIDWAKADLHRDLIDWADAIIVHHFPERWIAGQWNRLLGKRIIWRTCGQSDPDVESYMAPLRKTGLQIVRYSPKERAFFEPMRRWAGEDALIRFGKYPGDFPEWSGSVKAVANLTQNMKERGAFCGFRFWSEATEGLPVIPAGAGSEEIGGIGRISYEATFDYWRTAGVHLYTGTSPASYTLSLIESMMAGVPTVSIAASAFPVPGLFEGDVIALASAATPEEARYKMRAMLRDPVLMDWSGRARQRAIELFGIETVGAQWRSFLG